MNEGGSGNPIILPQWLPARRTVETREAQTFSAVQSAADYAPSIETFREILADFSENPSPFVGADLMGVAVVIGLEPESRHLAEYVLSEPITGRTAEGQARRILGQAQLPPDDDERVKVRAAKLRTSDFPRDAYAWMDQARLYTILGHYEKARTAVLAALHLAPADRIVVRSATRFFTHHDDWDDALHYARRAYSQNPDPMLLGLLVGIGTHLEKMPLRLRATAETALKAEDRFLYSEVLGAIGTLELLNGADKRSKKFFKRAWQDPAKAVVSQSQWVLRERLPGLVGEQKIDFRQSAEAMSWLRFAVLDFEGALARGHEWVLEEPYSRSAHMHTSNAATIVDKYEVAKKAAERGLRASPGDILLHNNLAFAQLRSGDVTAAFDTFSPVIQVLGDPVRIAEMATYGLLQMSLGKHREGIEAYKVAIRRAKEAGNQPFAVRAALNLIISSVDICHSVDVELLRQTSNNLREISDPGCFGTAMSLARRLARTDLEKSDAVEAAGREFTEAIKTGGGRLLGSLFAESVSKATSDDHDLSQNK